SMRWLAVDALEESDATAFHDPVISGDSLAFLQYTSGSTGNPKGVALTHSNVLHNLGRIRDAFEMTESSVSLMWVPPYHDMGLIGGVLAPLAVGIPAYLMSPVDFLLRPMRWLRTIARYRVTVSCAPNFAYDLCVRKSTPEERSALDLSSWRVAGNGAEPLRAETIERFVRAFEPSGFRSDALRPCYGLAEATLLVTMAKARSGGATVAHFDGSSLERGCARPPIAGKASVQLVSSGQAASDLRVVIVDPDSMSPCEAGRVGEVWIAGPSVATGYFAAQEETMLVFDAQLEKERYLRTGDLGFLDGDELFVTGRIKDVIIVRGCNHYPQDIETTVMECHSAMRPGCGAAFAVTIEGEERVIVAQEMDPGRGDPALLLAIARRAILEHHDVPLHAVLLLGPRTIPKTSSGKIQRQACRASYLAGTLETLARWPGSTSK
ncbi:MAG TPA: fatty acyl-AMP ligase, partial [Polyangiaceae bacterium]|nr:fatty acyl-AMP ligase [Polyangiaceae bacterium]